MKKFLLFALIALNGIAFADDPCQPCPEVPYPKLENCRCYNVFGFGEFLYWRYSAANLVYGRTGVSTAGVSESGTSLLPEFEYDPGFRVGMGVKFGAKKAFDVVGIYTRLFTNPEGSISATPSISTFAPVNWFNSATTATNTYTAASEALKLTLNYVEVQSGYGFGINRYLLLRPYIALTSYIMKGDLKARYEFTTLGPVVFMITETHGKSSSWSIGPKMGLDFVVRLADNWGIFTNFNITQQLTHISLKTEMTQNVPATGSSLIIQRGHLTQNRNVGLFGLEIGPTWDEWFFDNKYHVAVRATYSASTLTGGADISFLNNNNQDVGVNGEIRGLNVRATFEF